MPSPVPVSDPLPRINIQSFNSLGFECAGGNLYALNAPSFASGAWTANRLIMAPLLVPRPTLVSQFYWVNGATVDAAGHVDVGVYSLDGQTKFGSAGSTTPTGTNAIQTVDVTNFYLPGNTWLWLTLGCDSATQTFFKTVPAVTLMDFAGVKEQLSGWSGGLPATVTPATPTVAVLPLFGFTGASVI
jgi:hypothetical protein